MSVVGRGRRPRLSEGTGKLTANGRSFESYFSHENFAKQAYAPLNTVELRAALKKAGHITRDPREKERKKPGQPGARKRFQFSKR